MSENENENKKQEPLNINIQEHIQVESDVTVQLSDITVTARDIDNVVDNLVYPEAVSSDVIAKDVCEKMGIPADASTTFEEFIVEYVDQLKKEPFEMEHELSLPLDKLHPKLPNLKFWSLKIKRGEISRTKKFTIRKQQPKDD